MAITAQELNVILSARDKQFTKAMERAQRRVEKFSAKSQKDLSRTTKAVNALSVAANRIGPAFAFTAVTAGLSNMLQQAAKTAFEIEKLANLSGVGTERFQELAYASKSVGVEQDKLADILKDTNDKFGDYFATGAGPLADFFENIAPKVGVTAKAFQGLSSDQALGLYVKTLQDAGVNQQELTFYMEALASDATLLAPLLTNNAQALNSMATEARNLGAVIEDDVISATANMQTRFDQAMTAMQTKFKKFAMGVVVGFDVIFQISEEEQAFRLEKEIKKIEDQLGRVSNSIRRRTLEPKGDLVKNQEAIDSLVQQQLRLQNTLNELRGAYDLILQGIIDRNELDETLDSLLTGGNTGSGTSSADNIAAVNKQLKIMGPLLDDLDSIANTLENSLENVFMSAIDGADSFKDTVRQTAAAVVRELYRVLVVQRLVNAAMGLFGVSPAPVPSVGGNAAGGAVYAGQPTVVGEHGRELFVPSSAGRILSVPQAKAAMGGGESIVVNQTINVSTGVQQTVRNEIKTLMPQIAESAKSAVADAKRRGGSYGRAFA